MDLVIFKIMDYIRVEIELKMFYYIHLPEETYNISKKNNDKENEERKKICSKNSSFRTYEFYKNDIKNSQDLVKKNRIQEIFL